MKKIFETYGIVLSQQQEKMLNTYYELLVSENEKMKTSYGNIFLILPFLCWTIFGKRVIQQECLM